jgi:peptidoglycan/xylan/chitin deacetylase (PgdA/CDA1 family)
MLHCACLSLSISGKREFRTERRFRAGNAAPDSPRRAFALILSLILSWLLLATSTGGCGLAHGHANPGPNGVAPANLAPQGSTFVGPHGLPIPPGPALARPVGAVGNLRVLDWAGFRAAVSWTFDDAQPSHIEHYAELQSVGVPMTFYFTSGNRGPAAFDATWVRAVRDGHELGNHSAHHCHADLSGCLGGRGEQTLAREVDECTRYITEHYPQPGVWTLAAPFGDGGYEAIAATRFLVNRGVWPGMIAPRDRADPFNLPCYAVVEGDTAGRFNRQTRLARDSGKWLIFLVHTLTPTPGGGYAPVPVGEVVAGMRYGRSLGDVWMGTVVDVAAYWIGQKVLMDSVPATSNGVTTWTWSLPVGFPPGKYLRVRVDGGILAQGGSALPWDEHGYFEVALDARSLTLAP